jgi:hypothetical protein
MGQAGVYQHIHLRRVCCSGRDGGRSPQQAQQCKQQALVACVVGPGAWADREPCLGPTVGDQLGLLCHTVGWPMLMFGEQQQACRATAGPIQDAAFWGWHYQHHYLSSAEPGDVQVQVPHTS